MNSSAPRVTLTNNSAIVSGYYGACAGEKPASTANEIEAGIGDRRLNFPASPIF